MRKIAIIFSVFLLPSLAFSYEAKVLKLMGNVYVIPYSKAEVRAKEGMELFEKDTIKTGDDGWVSVELPDKSKINIGNKSLITIYKSKQDITVQIDRGKINAKVNKVKDREITFKTNTAIAGIRG
ncbi:MAG: FecR family protein, partial [Proteobacteria bacterium]|nr:FecR family protein [Pseudomonadota bacterium]